MILFSEACLADLERVFEFYQGMDEALANSRVEQVRRAVLLLDEHPYIGRPVPGSELRELVISIGKRGFVVLYAYDELEELARVLAVRHQREAGSPGR